MTYAGYLNSNSFNAYKHRSTTRTRMLFSAEPRRTAGYSRDIGWRVIWQKVGMGLTFRQVAFRLQLAVSTRDTGDLSQHKRNGKRHTSNRKLDELHELYILGMLADNPGLYLNEITSRIKEATNIVVDGSTVCRLLHRNGFTRKKIVQTAKQRCIEYRAGYMADVFAYKKEMFVFIDETGSDSRDHIRRFGYAIQGEASVYHRWLARGKRISAIAAISCDGLLECELVTGTVNGEVFPQFVRGNLIPQMLPFDGINNRSISASHTGGC